MKKTLLILSILIFTALILISCTVKADSVISEKSTKINEIKITIASQYGLQYAPAQIMEKMKLIEKYLPGAKVEWKTLPSGAVINESFVAGKIDIAFMGLHPFLISWDKGVPIKLASAVEGGPNNLMTYRNDLKNIKDIKENDKIAMPSSNSTQYFLLAMACEKILGNPHALDNNIVAMDHPSAYNALMTKKDIAAHFSSAPYVFEEDKPGFHNILNGKEAYGGDYTHIYAVTSIKFHDKTPQAYAAFISAMNEAINIINTKPQSAASVLAGIYKISEDKTFIYLTGKDVNYSTTPYGIKRTIDFMSKYGYIKKVPNDYTDIAFENMTSIIGKKNGEKTAIEKLQ